MDTSEEYIKMCACDEVQGQWTIPPRKHDFVYHIKSGFQLHGGVISPNDRDLPHGFVFLPRQDQIQEMMGFKDLNVLMCDLWAFHSERLGYVLDNFKSMEQLWLAFYMSENHQKIWDGDKWIKSETE